MAIRMRYSKDTNSVCCNCGERKDRVLDMYDVCIGKNIFTICDLCNDELQRKTLKAIVQLNGRVRTPKEQQIIRKRLDGSYKTRRRSEN